MFSRVNENKFTVPAGFDKILLIGGDGLDVKLFLSMDVKWWLPCPHGERFIKDKTINVLGWQSIFKMLICNLNKATRIAGIKPEQRSRL